jgi:hypothetical protein
MPRPEHAPTTPVVPGPAPYRLGGAVAEPGRSRPRLPTRFRWFAVGAALCTAGLVTFGLIRPGMFSGRNTCPIAGAPGMIKTAGPSFLAIQVRWCR